MPMFIETQWKSDPHSTADQNLEIDLHFEKRVECVTGTFLLICYYFRI